jgi:hypothetical protein
LKFVPVHDIKAYGGIYLEIHSFLSSVPDGREWSSSHPGRFASRELPHALNRVLSGFQRGTGRFGEKYLIPVGVPNSDLPARSLAVMPNTLAGYHQYVSLYFRRTITFFFCKFHFLKIYDLLWVTSLLTSVRTRMSTGGDCNYTSVLLKGRKILNSLIRYEVVQKNSPSCSYLARLPVKGKEKNIKRCCRNGLRYDLLAVT